MTFPHVAIIKRLAKSGSQYDYADVGSIKCFLQPLDAETAQLYGIVFTKASACYLPITSDVSESDRLEIDGAKYNVKGIRIHNYGSLRHRYAFLEQVS